MQLGFVIDHTRCIGCHACTVACKSENDVPVGKFRTWVKYVEQGAFPDVRRSFAVLRCNQCSDAPCVTICPVGALDKRDDGIVDVDPARCIGCKSCLHACPYDALYIHDERGVAEKCHFCAHRTERGLAPACAVVCPTEAIIPGDFHDPGSRVSQLKAAGDLTARKTEARTGPNVWYREVDPAGIDPGLTGTRGGFLWTDLPPGLPEGDDGVEASRGAARTVYDVSHPPPWGWRITAYLVTKSLSAGAGLVAALLLSFPDGDSLLGAHGSQVAAVLGLVFLAVTAALLVLDLKRPERFLFILRYPNWSSWLTRGTVILTAYGALALLWLGLELSGTTPGGITGTLLLLAVALAACLTAIYTAWLFAQARGRVGWMRRGLAAGLAAHAVVAGAAGLLLTGPLHGLPPSGTAALRGVLAFGLLAQGLLLALERRGAPRGREAEYSRVLARGHHGSLARRRRRLWILLGLALATCLVPLPVTALLAASLALLALVLEHDLLVRSGQAAPIS